MILVRVVILMSWRIMLCFLVYSLPVALNPMKLVMLSELLAHQSLERLLSGTAVSAVRVVLLGPPVKGAIPGSEVLLVMLEALVRVAMLQRS